MASRARSSLDKAEPFFGAILGFLPVFGGKVSHPRVEVRIARAGGLGNQVPFEPLDGIGGDALAFDENVSEAVLRDGAVLAGGAVEERHCGWDVFGYTRAVEQCDGKFNFGQVMLSRLDWARSRE